MQVFHVIFRSYFGKILFHEREDYLAYLRFVKRACEKYEMGWLAYALMPNHIHLVLRGDGEKLPHVRYNISSGYAAYYRKKYASLCGRKDLVFQPRNTTKWLQAGNDLKQVLRYVNRNPITGGLEQVLGESCNSSYNGILAARDPDNMKNPFNACDELREIRDALDAESVYRVFGRSHSEQWQNFIAFHQVAAPEPMLSADSTGAAGAVTGRAGQGTTAKAKGSMKRVSDLQKAETILKQYFSKRHSFYGKAFNEKNRQAFLKWLGRRGNSTKTQLVLALAAETSLSSREIAELLKIGHSTVHNIVKSQPQ